MLVLVVKSYIFEKQYSKSAGDFAVDRRIVYLILILSAVVSSTSLVVLLKLNVVEAVSAILLFPLISIVSLLGVFVMLAFIVITWHLFFGKSLNNATSIPCNRETFLPFGVASIMISFTFFTLVLLLTPEGALGNLPIISSLQLGEFLRDIVLGTRSIDTSLLLLLQFLLFPLSGGLTLALIRVHRTFAYGWGRVDVSDRNAPAHEITKAFDFLCFSSIVLLILSTLFGKPPSGYPLADYYFTLFTMILPASFFTSWIASSIIAGMEKGLNGQSRKLASLRFAKILQEVPEIDFTKKKALVYERLDFNEKKILDLLGVKVEPEKWEGHPFWKTIEFAIDLESLTKAREKIMEFQKYDTMAIPIETEEFRRMIDHARTS